MEANFTTTSKNSFIVVEGKYRYTMPFVLKHLLDKYLASLKEETTILPISKWFLSLSPERQLLVHVTENEEAS